MAAKPLSPTIAVFIGSSSEGESYADGVKEVLERRPDKQPVKITARTWPDVFAGYQSMTTIEVLLEILDDYDFGVFVLSRDDVRLFRGDQVDSPRDNVVLEIGLFTGKLGRERTFFLVPDDFKLKLPSDLGSMVAGTYTDDETRSSAVRTAVMHAKTLMLRKGPRTDRDVDARGDASRAEPPVVTFGDGSTSPLGVPPDGWSYAASQGKLLSLAGRSIEPGMWVVAVETGLARVVEVLPAVSGDSMIVALAYSGRDRPAYLAESRLFLPELAP